MKKTLSINISGILFHIEEDGYTTLKKYLDAINEHFSHYEDNHEIITDIESRIAEIFLSNLKNNKQVITAEDVGNLIEKMGTIADFEAVEETAAEDQVAAENDFYKYITPNDQQANKAYKKLTRFQNGKILGGVCAGFAHYFSIDPLWTRLIAILLLFSGGLRFGSLPFGIFGDSFNFQISLGWWTVLAYGLLWAILPVSYEKPEDKNIKKLYRNPDDRVLGGVGSGLAAYFNIDVIWVRLAFVAMVFAGGAGVVLYLILWIITPMAKSITERIEMKGGAITLSNIETTIQQNIKPEESGEESALKRVILLPFRVIGYVLNGLGRALGPFGKFLLEFVRVIFGLLIFFLGMVITLAPLILLGVYSEVLTDNDWGYVFEGIPVEAFVEVFPLWLAISAAMVIIIPGMVITLLGISVLIKRSLIDARFGLVIFGVWILSILFSAFQFPKLIGQFKEQASLELDHRVPLPEETLLIKSTRRSSSDTGIGSVSLTLKGHPGNAALLEQNFTSKGRTESEAMENAEDVTYEYNQADSILTFGSHLGFPDLSKYRGQYLRQTLLLPYDYPFVMDRTLIPILRNTVSTNGYKNRDINGRNHWVFNEEGLLCLTCEGTQRNTRADSLSRAKFRDKYFMQP
ncbi:PspC domain-containing protein [Lunatimonas salinarum]|uniref:PspC domain-containing protein n=1 Tax=Lunatimonas salinarum TaxID=1774590 RepID=UPI001AE04BA4|nr:PspC domain-containing protein [Lunatimonas salinarum]